MALLLYPTGWAVARLRRRAATFVGDCRSFVVCGACPTPASAPVAASEPLAPAHPATVLPAEAPSAESALRPSDADRFPLRTIAIQCYFRGRSPSRYLLFTVPIRLANPVPRSPGGGLVRECTVRSTTKPGVISVRLVRC